MDFLSDPGRVLSHCPVVSIALVPITPLLAALPYGARRCFRGVRIIILPSVQPPRKRESRI